MTNPVDLWYHSLARSRSRMGIKVPPFRWKYLLKGWGWRCYVWNKLKRKAGGPL